MLLPFYYILSPSLIHKHFQRVYGYIRITLQLKYLFHFDGNLSTIHIVLQLNSEQNWRLFVIQSGLGVDLWNNDPTEMTKLPCGSGDHNKVRSLDMVETAMTWLVSRKSEFYPHSSLQDLETDYYIRSQKTQKFLWFEPRKMPGIFSDPCTNWIMSENTC